MKGTIRTYNFQVRTEKIQAQVQEVKNLLNSLPEELAKRFLGEFDCYFSSPGTDVIIGDYMTTSRADGTHELVGTVRFGPNFERLIAALRAGKCNV